MNCIYDTCYSFKVIILVTVVVFLSSVHKLVGGLFTSNVSQERESNNTT